jgi:cysteine desulfurase / selenocysteine lyase
MTHWACWKTCTSATTMNTSDLGAVDQPAPAGVLDAALIARLANEFFAAMPAVTGSGPLPAAPEGVAAFVPENPSAVSAQGVHGSPAYIPNAAEPAPLNVAPSFPVASDVFSFRSVPGMQLTPENPGAVSSQGSPGPPAYISNVAEPASLNVAPSFPVASDLFSFPSVPGMQLTPESPGAVSSQGSPGPPVYISNAAEPVSLNVAPSFPVASDLFSSPSVPGMQPVPNGSIVAVPSREKVPATSDSMPDPLALAQLANQFFATLPKNGTSPEAASPAGAFDPRGLVVDGEGAAGQAPEPLWPPASELFSFTNVPAGTTLAAGHANSAPFVAAPNVLDYSLWAKRGSPFDAALSLPGTSDLFTLPGVPGAQSLPGTPALASSPPATPTEKADFRPEMVPDLGRAKRPFDPHLVRRDFPILQERVHGRPLIWLDNAATTQKPNAVIDRLSYFYQHENSNVHRAAHTLAARATDAYESAREKVRRFVNASSTREIVFVRGTTEGINLVAQAWGRRNVQKDDEIVITWLEHHANIVPWQQLCAEKGARLRVAPVDDRGEVILEEYEKLLGPRTRMVSFTQVSNALGTVTPAPELVKMAHRHGARVLVDGAQSVAHMASNVQALDCDFYIFSGHKIFGPTGIGVLYGKADILDHIPPWQGGGSMIADVTFEKTTYQLAPARFEAGTGNIADAVGLGAALDYLEEIGIENVNRHEHELLTYATAALMAVPGLRVIGTAREKAAVISFVLDGFRTEDVGMALNQEGIAVRAGHHCAQPILRRFGVESTVRPSLALYNTTEDIDALVSAILRMQAGRSHGKL